MSQHPETVKRNSMPVPILLAAALSVAFIGVWVVVAFLIAGEAAAAPLSAVIAWTVIIGAGVLVNLVIIVGLMRRVNGVMWAVAMQAMVLIAILAVAANPVGVWGILAVASQCVLVAVPASSRWFSAGQVRRARERRMLDARR